MNNKKMLDFQTIAVDLMALSATANGRGLVSQTWHLLNISGNGAMPLCLFWHSFLVSAGYLPNTVFLIIKICWLNFFKFCYFIR